MDNTFEKLLRHLRCNIDARFNKIVNNFVLSNTHNLPLKMAILCEKTAIIEVYGVPGTRKFVIQNFLIPLMYHGNKIS